MRSEISCRIKTVSLNIIVDIRILNLYTYNTYIHTFAGTQKTQESEIYYFTHVENSCKYDVGLSVLDT
jgi:hypothetical protein